MIGWTLAAIFFLVWLVEDRARAYWKNKYYDHVYLVNEMLDRLKDVTK